MKHCIEGACDMNGAWGVTVRTLASLCYMDTEDFPCIYLFTNKTDAFKSCIDNNIDHQKKL